MSNRPSQAHPGHDSHHGGHSHDPLVNYELIGAIRWLDVELSRVVIHVEATGGHAGPFLGQDVTVDLAAATIQGAKLEDLLPGVRVRAKTRLHDDFGTALPELVEAHSLYKL